MATRKTKTSDVFFMKPENRAFAAGKTKTVHTTVGLPGCVLVFLSVFVIVGIGLIYGAFRLSSNYVLLSRTGVETAGQFISRQDNSDSDGESYRVTYSYEFNGRVYERNEDVSRAVYQTSDDGAPLRVVVVPSNPDLASIDMSNDRTLSLIMFGFALFWNVFTIPLFIWGANGWLKSRRLAREGKVIRGEIVKASGYNDSDNDYNIKVDYRFPSRKTGEEIYAHTEQMRNDLNDRLLPSPGTTVAVLYLDDSTYMLL